MMAILTRSLVVTQNAAVVAVSPGLPVPDFATFADGFPVERIAPTGRHSEPGSRS
jgi:hypothetical protein